MRICACEHNLSSTTQVPLRDTRSLNRLSFETLEAGTVDDFSTSLIGQFESYYWLLALEDEEDDH